MSDIQTADAAAGEVTLRDDLRSALTELKEKGGDDSDAARLSELEEQRARDEKGRFAPKQDVMDEQKPKRDTLTLKPKDQPAPVADPNAPAPDVQPTTVKAPDGLKAEEKAKFAELPDWAQQMVMRRETEAHRALTRQDEERQFGRQALELTRPYMETIQREGGKPLDAYRLYLETAQIMRTGTPEQKGAAIASVCRQFGVPPQHLFNALTGGNIPSVQPGQQVPFDPRFESLAQRQERIEQALIQQEQMRQQQETEFLQGHIEEFSASPGHEHFETVKDRMGTLLVSGLAKDMQDAYDQAVWSDPTIRSTLAAATNGNAEQKRLQELKAKADAAKRASGSINGGPGGGKPPSTNDPSRSLRDEIKEQMRAATGRI